MISGEIAVKQELEVVVKIVVYLYEPCCCGVVEHVGIIYYFIIIFLFTSKIVRMIEMF